VVNHNQGDPWQKNEQKSQFLAEPLTYFTPEGGRWEHRLNQELMPDF
jgi:hypothetical protein